jgi:glycosyltransferase involved in cell wall biosynthesis
VNYALTAYPLSNGFQNDLETALTNKPVYLSLSTFRTQPLRRTLAMLRGLTGARLVLPLEDDNGRLILPALLAVAALSNAESIEVRYPDLRAESIGRLDLLRSLCSVAAASARSAVSATACRVRLRRLLRTPRTQTEIREDRQALYLNANLWFGVKAGGSIGHVAGVVNALHKAGRDVLYASAGSRTMIDADISSVALLAPEAFGFPPELNQYRFHHMVVRQLKSLAAPGFIYQRMSIANYSGVMLSRHWGVPLVLEYNGSEAWVAQNWGRPLLYHDLAVQAEDACLRHAHAVVTISAVLRDELIDKGVSPDRIVFYPNCIDPEMFNPARYPTSDGLRLRSNYGISPDALLVTFVGTFGPWHGAEVLARAIRQLAATRPAWLRDNRLHFLFVGDGIRCAESKRILAGEILDRQVTFAGLVPQAEAPGYLAASDVVMSPHVPNADGTRFFGSPTKLFEYMAMGKPIIASDLDQVGEVLKIAVRASDLPTGAPAATASELAVLVKPGSETAIVRALEFLVEHPAWRATLGANARREALGKYTWKHHVAAILERLTVLGAGDERVTHVR